MEMGKVPECGNSIKDVGHICVHSSPATRECFLLKRIRILWVMETVLSPVAALLNPFSAILYTDPFGDECLKKLNKAKENTFSMMN